MNYSGTTAGIPEDSCEFFFHATIRNLGPEMCVSFLQCLYPNGNDFANSSTRSNQSLAIRTVLNVMPMMVFSLLMANP